MTDNFAPTDEEIVVALTPTQVGVVLAIIFAAWVLRRRYRKKG